MPGTRLLVLPPPLRRRRRQPYSTTRSAAVGRLSRAWPTSAATTCFGSALPPEAVAEIVSGWQRFVSFFHFKKLNKNLFVF